MSKAALNRVPRTKIKGEARVRLECSQHDSGPYNDETLMTESYFEAMTILKLLSGADGET